MSHPRGVDQRPENRSRRFVLIDRPFGMPLYCQHKVISRSSLERFDHPVLRRPGGHPQPIADNVGRLVMTGIYRNGEWLSLRG